MLYEEILETISEESFLTACPDKVHPPPRVVPAPVDNFLLASPPTSLHSPQASAGLVGQELVLLLIPHLSTISSDADMYCE